MSNSTKISNFIFKDFLHVNVEKNHYCGVIVKVQLKRSHLNGRTCFSSISSFFCQGLNGLMGSSDS